MDISPPETHQVRRRSKRPRPPPDADADEYAAAMSLVLLLKSGGDHPTISPPEAHQEVHPSAAAIAKKQKLESLTCHRCSLCDRVFKSSQALEGHMAMHRDEKEKAVIHECCICHETFNSEQAFVDHLTKHCPDESTNIAAGDSTWGNGDSGGASSSSRAKPVSDFNMQPIVSITMFHSL